MSKNRDVPGKNKLAAIAGVLAMTVLAASVLASHALGDVAAAQTGNQNGQTPSNGTETSNQSDNTSPLWLFKLNKKYDGYEDGALQIRAGTGGPVAPLTWFFPRSAEIKVGEPVTWYNPTSVGEPHTVTFISDSSDFPPLEVPYVISNNSTLVPLNPGANSDPTLIPGPEGKTVAMLANARAYLPVAITDDQPQYMPLNANYTMTGNESYVNSGLMWPEGQVPPGVPGITSFSIKFEKEGTYDYLCLLHPWMSGRITVQ